MKLSALLPVLSDATLSHPVSLSCSFSPSLSASRSPFRPVSLCVSVSLDRSIHRHTSVSLSRLSVSPAYADSRSAPTSSHLLDARLRRERVRPASLRENPRVMDATFVLFTALLLFRAYTERAGARASRAPARATDVTSARARGGKIQTFVPPRLDFKIGQPYFSKRRSDNDFCTSRRRLYV